MHRDTQEEISLLSYTFELSILLAVPVVIGAFCGYWIDQYFDTGFSFLILGIFGGIMIATILTVKKVSRVIKQADAFYAARKEQISREKQEQEQSADEK